MKNVEKTNRTLIVFLLHISVFVGFLAFAETPKVVDRALAEPVKIENISIKEDRIDPEVFAVPLRLNYQGFLTDDNGNAITDTATMVFRIFTAYAGGSQLWNSGNQLIDVEDGVFHYILAGVPMSVFEAGDARWLELIVRGQVLSPRTEITSVAWSYVATLADSAGGAARIGGQNLTALDGRYINNGESAGNDLSGTYPNPTVARIQTRAVSSSAPAIGQILKWNGTQWAPANDTIGGADNDWIISGNNMYSGVSGNVGIGTGNPQAKLDVNGVICGGVSDTVKAVYGAVLGGYSNLAGDAVNDTGAVVCGGWNNAATNVCATVGGGVNNLASGTRATSGGGLQNTASGTNAFVGAGYHNTASGTNASVVSGYYNTASSDHAFVGGGYGNAASGSYATVGGGRSDSANALYSGALSGYSNLAGDAVNDTGAVVCGGYNNSATDKYATVGGGYNNSATGKHSAVAGGYNNRAHDNAFVGGGTQNSADGVYATVGGGFNNFAVDSNTTVGGGLSNYCGADFTTIGGGLGNYAMAGGLYATIAGGRQNNTSGSYAIVGGGYVNTASNTDATVAGGYQNTASGSGATVGGGRNNTASGVSATVAGGYYNTASGVSATVAGGSIDTSAAYYSFTVGWHSVVPSAYSNSAAFNGQVSTASGQTRVGALSKASGTFTIDHPLDPMNKILNHYFVESPEMVLIYRGVATIGAGGRAEVQLPDYYEALNRNSQIQLTGVGTYEVYIAEMVRNNRFVIGGKPGTEVHWVVTGERKDPSAEITKIIMPVEQPKDGELAGRSLDDDFLCTTKEQLERMGKASGFNFRQASGQQRYDEMKRMVLENR